MFTGIIVDMGEVVQVRRLGRDCEFRIRSPRVAAQLEVGDSVALDGVCQTVTACDRESFAVHAIEETLRVTTLGDLAPGARVNLEPALRAGATLGGHFVQGHVDATAEILARQPHGESIRIELRGPAQFVQQLVPKGSVALDGISLTLAPELGRERFAVYLIPHTQQATTLGDKPVGARVNFELDILGKYVWRYLGQDRSEIDAERLRAAGFGSEE